ncbi:hypothetical protein I317_01781 [Kwoniella heveanensis CBS 569]|nr:hypothetical protein I317_01781 [Kwoniella heveanensis CBS 569]
MPSFEGFEEHLVPVQSKLLGKELQIYARKKGDGKRAVLLLHGYPQTHHIWHKIAPQLAKKYTVILTDLRGYGKSSKPPGSDSHEEYSKREMASDQLQVMQYFGFDKFTLIGHDRGARVSHRLALDYPQHLEGVMLLDIAPTLYMYENTDMAFANGYWHWFFLIQDAPGPENTMFAAPEEFWAIMGTRPSHKGVKWSEEDVDIYKNSLFTRECLHASCEDYRAAASIDLEHDRATRSSGQKLKVPNMTILWGKKGMIQTYNKGDVVSLWKEWCEDGVKISGRALDGGHYLPEERDEDVLQEIRALIEG